MEINYGMYESFGQKVLLGLIPSDIASLAVDVDIALLKYCII
jgi:hypothetical protein